MVGDGATDMEACPPADAFIGFAGNQVNLYSFPLKKSVTITPATHSVRVVHPSCLVTTSTSGSTVRLFQLREAVYRGCGWLVYDFDTLRKQLL